MKMKDYSERSERYQEEIEYLESLFLSSPESATVTCGLRNSLSFVDSMEVHDGY